MPLKVRRSKRSSNIVSTSTVRTLLPNQLSRFERQVLKIELDPILALGKNDECKVYHRCDIRWHCKTSGGLLEKETAEYMIFSFPSRKDCYAQHFNIAKRNISCVRLPGKRLLVRLPYVAKYECCRGEGSLYPPRERSLSVRLKKSLTRDEKKRRKRGWELKYEGKKAHARAKREDRKLRNRRRRR